MEMADGMKHVCSSSSMSLCIADTMDFGIAQNCAFFSPAQKCNPQNETYPGLWQARHEAAHRAKVMLAVMWASAQLAACNMCTTSQLRRFCEPSCTAGAYVAAYRERAGGHDGAPLQLLLHWAAATAAATDEQRGSARLLANCVLLGWLKRLSVQGNPMVLAHL